MVTSLVLITAPLYYHDKRYVLMASYCICHTDLLSTEAQDLCGVPMYQMSQCIPVPLILINTNKILNRLPHAI